MKRLELPTDEKPLLFLHLLAELPDQPCLADPGRPRNKNDFHRAPASPF